MSDFPRSTTGAVVVFLLLGLVGVAGAGLGSGFSADADRPPEVVTVTNSTNYVTPDSENITRQEYGEASLDVGAAMIADAERLQARHDDFVYEHQREVAVDDATAARAILRTVEARIDALDEQQAQLFTAYNDGELSTETLLTELVRLEVAAQQQRETIDELREEGVPPDVAERLDSLSVEMPLLTNPLSERLKAAKTAGTDPVRVYVASAPDSLVAATVIDDTYVRQMTLRDERDPRGTDQFAEDSPGGGAQAAGNRGSDLYQEQADTVRGFRETNVWEFRANHSQGELFAYLDGATTNPFHAHQFKRPVVDIEAETTSNTAESFRLNVQYTDPTGPMVVSLLGTGSDEPPAATISVEGERVGTIDGGGQLWTVQPIGEFTVTATTEDGQTVSVRVVVL